MYGARRLLGRARDWAVFLNRTVRTVARAAYRDRVLTKSRRWGLSRGCHGSIPKSGSVYGSARAP